MGPGHRPFSSLMSRYVSTLMCWMSSMSLRSGFSSLDVLSSCNLRERLSGRVFLAFSAKLRRRRPELTSMICDWRRRWNCWDWARTALWRPGPSTGWPWRFHCASLRKKKTVHGTARKTKYRNLVSKKSMGNWIQIASSMKKTRPFLPINWQISRSSSLTFMASSKRVVSLGWPLRHFSSVSSTISSDS